MAKKKWNNRLIDGNSSYITLSDEKDWDLDTDGDWTIDFWVRTITVKTKIRWWYLTNIYYPIRRFLGIREKGTFIVLRKEYNNLENILKNLTREEKRKLYDMLWHEIHDPEDFIGGND